MDSQDRGEGVDPIPGGEPDKAQPSANQVDTQAHQAQQDIKAENAVVTVPSSNACVREGRRAVVQNICLQVANGLSLRSVCKAESLNIGTLLGWIHDDAELGAMYRAALSMRAAGMAEELEELCLELYKPEISSERVQALKVIINTRQWAMSRLLPKMYGDHQIVEHTGTVQVDEKQLDTRLAQLLRRASQ